MRPSRGASVGGLEVARRGSDRREAEEGSAAGHGDGLCQICTIEECLLPCMPILPTWNTGL